MDVGEPVREIEVIPKHIPVPERDNVENPAREPVSTPAKEKEPAKSVSASAIVE